MAPRRRNLKSAATARVLGTQGRIAPIPCRVIVVENARGERRALRYWEWDAVPAGWTVVGQGSHLLRLED